VRPVRPNFFNPRGSCDSFENSRAAIVDQAQGERYVGPSDTIEQYIYHCCCSFPRRFRLRRPRVCSRGSPRDAEATYLVVSNLTVNISAHPLDPLSARGTRLEGIAEVLGLTGNLPVPELHDTHCVGRRAVVCKDEFSDPKVASTEYASHRKALPVRLRKTRRLNIASTADPLRGLRVFKHCIVAVNLMLRLEIIRV
jgi:hypothetical protein